jgi:hypothetical protein
MMPASELRSLEVDRKTALRVLDLVEAVMRDPFSGIGKPEPLKHLGGGVWSRRVIKSTAWSISFVKSASISSCVAITTSRIILPALPKANFLIT